MTRHTLNRVYFRPQNSGAIGACVSDWNQALFSSPAIIREPGYEARLYPTGEFCFDLIDYMHTLFFLQSKRSAGFVFPFFVLIINNTHRDHENTPARFLLVSWGQFGSIFGWDKISSSLLWSIQQHLGLRLDRLVAVNNIVIKSRATYHTFWTHPFPALIISDSLNAHLCC